ncbi:MAG: DUF5655 domain-containing protein [Bacteroidota bacterium]
MALRPKQMGEAIIRNLKEKTGKSVEEWIEVLKSEVIQDKKEIISFLKTKNGLGHFQAQKVFEHFNGKDNYADPTTFADTIFNTEKTMDLYEFSKAKILEIAEDIRIQPCKTYIPFYRKNQFAILTKAKGDSIKLGLNLPQNHTNPRFSAKPTNGSVRINAYTVIQSKADFDEEIISTIQEAYKTN